MDGPEYLMRSTSGAVDQLAIITVNYRAALDTLECLESIEDAQGDPWVVVVDNASGDASMKHFRSWVEQRPELMNEVDFRTSETLGDRLTKRITFIESSTNGGFASGNNIGLRVAAATPGIDLFWLLNNDTILDAQSVRAVVDYFSDKPEVGMAGTQLRLYHQRDRFQLLNGMTFSRATGAARGIHAGQSVASKLADDEVIRRSDFICGASLVMTRSFFEQVGYLEEKFFLYYEEVDLAYRGKDFALGYVADAIVFHKEGASAGSASQLSARARSPLSEYHHIRSKMLFARKHIPWAVPLYFVQNIVILLRRCARRQPAQARAVFNATFGRGLND